MLIYYRLTIIIYRLNRKRRKQLTVEITGEMYLASLLFSLLKKNHDVLETRPKKKETKLSEFNCASPIQRNAAHKYVCWTKKNSEDEPQYKASISRLLYQNLFSACLCLPWHVSKFGTQIATYQMEVVPKMSFAVNDVTSSLIVHATGRKKRHSVITISTVTSCLLTPIRCNWVS